MSHSRYAKSTRVPVSRSKNEIERTLVKYGADDIMMGTSKRGSLAFVAFQIEGRNVRMNLPLPSPDDKEFTKTATGMNRSESELVRRWEQACRQRWRVLGLFVKAQLEVVANGIMSIDEAFLPWVLLPDGRTIGEHVLPDLSRMLETGKVPTLPMNSSVG